MGDTRYDVIGAEYAVTRREDPRTAALIHAALGEAETVANVGAGPGSYEPRDRHVIPIEPSEVMIAQRDPSLPPAIRGGAYPLPIEDRSVTPGRRPPRRPIAGSARRRCRRRGW